MPLARSLAGPLLAFSFLGPGVALPAWAAEPATGKAVRGSLPLASGADPRHGQGTRKVAPKPSAGATPAAKPKAATPQGKGPAPKRPQATLPPGKSATAPDAVTRRLIAGGATADDLKQGKSDPELSKLREAERVLFPRAVEGLAPGWSWGLPEEPLDEQRVLSNGLPPAPERSAPSPLSDRDAEWLRGLVLPNLPIRYDDRVVKYLKFFRDSQSGKAVARVWTKKSGRYVDSLKIALSRAGLPTDLVWLSLIESGHNPTITSPVGAAGLWQFMPETARTYGLTVDRWVDQRLDPVESTEAAVRLLADLYRRFGSWELAMAAYNMGHGGLLRAIKKYNTNDFWELARHEAGIPWETTLYVPKILATAIVMNNKKAFGLDDVEADGPERFDVIEVPPGTPLADVARAASVDGAALERQNPMYLAGRVPPVAPGRASPVYRVRVPSGAANVAGRVFERSAADGLVALVVRQGDTPQSVARASGASEATIRSLNQIGAQEVLAAGTVLLVPELAPGARDATPRGEDPVVVVREVSAPPNTRRVFYPAVSGDTVASVAAVFGVARSDLIAWNALDSAAHLQEGMVLQVFPQKSRELGRVRVLGPGEAKVLVAGSSDFFDYFEGLNGKRRMVIAARAGDTLASIGRRYQTSIGWMERINRRSRSDRLVVGENVVVYVDRARFPAAAPPPKRTTPPVDGPVSVVSLAVPAATPPAARGVASPSPTVDK